MKTHPVVQLINQADAAINHEDFDTLIDIYADDAVLVIQPGMNAIGKAQIKRAFMRVADHFEHSLEVWQLDMEILETEDTALVLAKTVIRAKNLPELERKATYVFKKDANNLWRCIIDNSYGHELLEAN
ncbi:YybH family protein [Pseudomonadota bacterium]